jgi:hypothetical protein
MATRAQKWTAWALRLYNLIEMLEPHLEEITQQKESKLQHPNPLDRGTLLHTRLHWENRRHWLQTCLGDIQRTKGEHQASHGIPPASPRINQHGPLGPCKKHQKTKQKKTEQYTRNWKLTHSRGPELPKAHHRSGESKVLISAQTYSKKRLKSQKGWQRAGDKPRPEIGQGAVHKAHLLSQWVTSKVKQHCKIEKQSANHHNTLAAWARCWFTDLAPEKEGEAKKQALNNQAQWKPNSKAGQLVDYRADSGTWG